MTDEKEKPSKTRGVKTPTKSTAKTPTKVPEKTAKKASTKHEPPKRPEYKYGVHDLSRELDLQEASVRVALRKFKVAKAIGGVYGWNTKTELEDVVNAIRPKPAKKSA